MNEKKLPKDLSLLEERLGHTFSEPAYLRTALTHSSYSNELRAHGTVIKYNERMEFLGDAVLQIVTSEYLFTTYPDLPEGDLSPIRASAVCEEALFRCAKAISLGDYLLLGKGEEHDGRNKKSILADAFEAVLAALFLDGGIGAVKPFLLPILSEEVDEIVRTASYKDYKTELQQFIQADRGEHPEYFVVSESGPAHKKLFEVEAMLNSNVIGRGKGSSKREAEQQAAKEALRLFGLIQ